jgi:hypothetical protein
MIYPRGTAKQLMRKRAGGPYSTVTILVAILAILAFIRWGGLTTAKTPSKSTPPLSGVSDVVLRLGDLPSGWRASSSSTNSLHVADTTTAHCTGATLPGASQEIGHVASPDFTDATSAVAVASDAVAYLSVADRTEVLDLYGSPNYPECLAASYRNQGSGSSTIGSVAVSIGPPPPTVSVPDATVVTVSFTVSSSGGVTTPYTAVIIALGAGTIACAVEIEGEGTTVSSTLVSQVAGTMNTRLLEAS